MRAASAFRRSDPRAPSTTFAPRSASSSAVASPIPLLAPVITTTLPSIPDMKSPTIETETSPIQSGTVPEVSPLSNRAVRVVLRRAPPRRPRSGLAGRATGLSRPAIAAREHGLAVPRGQVGGVCGPFGADHMTARRHRRVAHAVRWLSSAREYRHAGVVCLPRTAESFAGGQVSHQLQLARRAGLREYLRCRRRHRVIDDPLDFRQFDPAGVD